MSGPLAGLPVDAIGFRILVFFVPARPRGSGQRPGETTPLIRAAPAFGDGFCGSFQLPNCITVEGYGEGIRAAARRAAGDGVDRANVRRKGGKKGREPPNGSSLPISNC
jgi:hypothetical protein